MVLHHVAQLTHPVVISPTALDAHFFGNGNLNVINAALIPLGVDKAVGKSEHQKVLDCLFAQIMIDSIDILLIEKLSECLVDFTRRIEALANWLFRRYGKIPPSIHLYLTVHKSWQTVKVACEIKKTGARLA